MREHTTDSKHVVPPPSTYAWYRESLPMLSDPVLQDYCKEELVYAENKELAKQWEKVIVNATSFKAPTIAISAGKEPKCDQTNFNSAISFPT